MRRCRSSFAAWRLGRIILYSWWAALPLWLLNVEPMLAGSGDVASGTPKVLTASIYSSESKPQRLLYKFRRTIEVSGDTLAVRREYSYPDGKLAARERVEYQGSSLKRYDLEEFQTGGAGSALVQPDPRDPARRRIAFRYAASASALPTSGEKYEPLAENTLVNDTVGQFLAAHWRQLLAGQSVRCRYLVIPRRETVGFSFKRQSESTWHGKEVITVTMRPTNPLVSALVAPLLFTIEKAPPHRVLQYAGRTTPKIRQGNRWEDLDALTVFDW